nr:hypothetical protein [Tanacetum cinerariifolium]
QYGAAGLGFYQCNNRNSSYPDRRQTLEESLAKFMAESTKRHEENSNIIEEIRASTDAATRNQGASIKTLEIQIGQMSKVLQERRIGGLPGSTEPNPKDHVKSISTTKDDSSEIRRMGCIPYVVLGSHHRSIFSETIPFPSKVPSTEEPKVNQEKDVIVNNTNNINTISPTDNAAGIVDNVIDENIVYGCADDPNIPDLEEISIFRDAENDDLGADMNNLDIYFQVGHVPTTRIHKDC